MDVKKIVALMAGHDSRNPMPFDALVEVSGLQPATLEMVLEQMINMVPAPINRALLIQGDRKWFTYWPTGVVDKAVRQDIVINPRKTPPSGQVYRRTEKTSVQKPESPKTKEQIMANEEKSYTRIMLEYLAEHGFATNAKLIEVSGAVSTKPFLKHKIAAGLLLSESGNYRLADGVTPDELLSDGRKRNTPPHKQSDAEEQVQAKPDAQTNVVEFKRAEASTEVTHDDIPERGMTTHDVCVNADGQLVIQLPGKVRMVFPAPDTKRIKAYLAAIDLESLCA